MHAAGAGTLAEAARLTHGSPGVVCRGLAFLEPEQFVNALNGTIFQLKILTSHYKIFFDFRGHF